MKETNFGNYLQMLRKKHKLSQREVASYLNISRQTCSHYENGRISPPLDALISLANLYHISLDEILIQRKILNAPALPDESANPCNENSISKLSSISLIYEPSTITEEVKFIHSIRTLTLAQKHEVLHFIEYLNKLNLEDEKV